jgi:hypothetical protein
MGSAAKFFVCLLISAAFFLFLKFKVLNNYISNDKDKASCEANADGDENSCQTWYSDYSLCLKGIKDETGACQQKNITVPVALAFGGLFFGLAAIFTLL